MPLPVGPTTTLYIHQGEDTSEELQTVYLENGGVPGRIAFLNDLALRFDGPGLTRVRRLARRLDAGLVVVDNLLYFVMGTVRNLNDADQVAPVLMALARVAHETRATFLDLRHTRKAGSERQQAQADPGEAGLGSVAIRAAHRGQLVVQRYRSRPGVSFVTCERGSIFAPPGDPFAFRKVGLELLYLPDEPTPHDPEPAEPPGARGRARAALRAMLDGGVERPAKEIERRLVAEMGISFATYRRARAELAVCRRREGDGLTVYRLRPDAADESLFGAAGERKAGANPLGDPLGNHGGEPLPSFSSGGEQLERLDPFQVP